ncbi:unnamed protein product [Amoebophrya sp. A25]|nr:unnamed protein product [Amoebophrya sp. A25]|eukprot:GSA25T00015203001.1
MAPPQRHFNPGLSAMGLPYFLYYRAWRFLSLFVILGRKHTHDNLSLGPEATALAIDPLSNSPVKDDVHQQWWPNTAEPVDVVRSGQKQNPGDTTGSSGTSETEEAQVTAEEEVKSTSTSSRLRSGYLDCSESGEALDEKALRRAYRRMALDAHPDVASRRAVEEGDLKGQESNVGDIAELRDRLIRDPLQFQVYRAMFDGKQKLRPFDEGDEVFEQVVQTTFSSSAATDTTERTVPTSVYPSSSSATSRIQGVAARIVRNADGDSNWPYIEMVLRVDNRDGQLSAGGRWSFAIGHKGVSTIHYRGDEAQGGYDLCCSFMLGGSPCTTSETERPVGNVEQLTDTKDTSMGDEGGTSKGGSKCTADDGAQQSRDESCVKGQKNGQNDTTSEVGERESQNDVETPSDTLTAFQNDKDSGQKSDCPLPARDDLLFRVRRPLHLDSVGQWGSALRIRDAKGGKPLVCAALAFPVFEDQGSDSAARRGSQDVEGSGKETQTDDHEGAMGNKARANNKTHDESDQNEDGSRCEDGDRQAKNNQELKFQLLKAGEFCEDGIDILEGPVDNYSSGGFDPFDFAPGREARAMTPQSELYGGNCRAKCAKKKRCRFYTIYSSGWCQLSTRCSRTRPTGDPLAATFIKI